MTNTITQQQMTEVCRDNNINVSSINHENKPKIKTACNRPMFKYKIIDSDAHSSKRFNHTFIGFGNYIEHYIFSTS